MNTNIYLYIAVMALATYFCRVFAFTVVRHPIENRFFQSFLYYVPYVTFCKVNVFVNLHRFLLSFF